VQPDPQEGQPVVKLGDVCELPAEPVEGLGDDDLETAALGVEQNLLELLPESTGAALSVIGIHPDKLPALALDVAPAALDLVLDRGFALLVRAEAGISSCAQREIPVIRGHVNTSVIFEVSCMPSLAA
jgi:hypothetical protein